MQTSDTRLQELFDRWVKNQCSPAEQEEFLALVEKTGPDELTPALEAAWLSLQPERQLSAGEKDSMVDNIFRQSPAQPVSGWSRWWAAAAAALVLCFAGGAWYGLQKNNRNGITAGNNSSHDVEPGKEGAILTLGNGQTIVLDTLGNGVIAQQSGTQVVLQNGSLSYEASGADEASFNTMTTPRGRKFQLVLPDGSKVWLNAASSLRYPTAFTGQERRVEITGEAYFEISKDAARPFIVKINEQTDIQVLGTQFNVNAYTDEANIQTTLVEGSVRVRSSGQSRVLTPGQQAQISNKGGNVTILDHANVDQVTAWKNGFFNFHGASLPEVMRQLSRWYDIDVIYEGTVPDQQFEGELPTTLQLSQVIKILTKVDVKFRIEEGQRLIVLP
ncbi:DUF4974 domain-containing protein [Chitinophaga lutea]|uniref:DUF4974 domain-containing protein n=1 Tax=Chitinophaga lutea TaxID=2488634 RepID=A0A3N4PW31_9BACT|nr:FecR family protein [Chitinophaga lutea]RPE07940.1 DUF4974 domain-containing protein [Chitinophaga lutea]